MELKQMTAESAKLGKLFKVLLLYIIFKIIRKPLPMLCEYSEYSETLAERNKIFQTLEALRVETDKQLGQLLYTCEKLNAVCADYGSSAVSRKVNVQATAIAGCIVKIAEAIKASIL
jgi:hypothetical protein